MNHVVLPYVSENLVPITTHPNDTRPTVHLTYFRYGSAMTMTIVPADGLQDALNALPDRILYLHIEAPTVTDGSVLPIVELPPFDLSQFRNLRTLKLRNLLGLYELPKMATVDLLVCKRCGIRTLANIPLDVAYLTLSDNPNLTFSEVPIGVAVLEVTNQRLDEFHMTDNLETCTFNKCSINRIHNVPAMYSEPVRFDPVDRCVFDMYKCITPYQELIDAQYHVSGYNPNIDRGTYLQEMFTHRIASVVNEVNSYKDTVSLAVVIHNTVLRCASTNSESPIECVLGIQSNYPRRWCEFLEPNNTKVVPLEIP